MDNLGILRWFLMSHGEGGGAISCSIHIMDHCELIYLGSLLIEVMCEIHQKVIHLSQSSILNFN